LEALSLGKHCAYCFAKLRRCITFFPLDRPHHDVVCGRDSCNEHAMAARLDYGQSNDICAGEKRGTYMACHYAMPILDIVTAAVK
jgi:hypothetical protein